MPLPPLTTRRCSTRRAGGNFRPASSIFLRRTSVCQDIMMAAAVLPPPTTVVMVHLHLTTAATRGQDRQAQARRSGTGRTSSASPTSRLCLRLSLGTATRPRRRPATRCSLASPLTARADSSLRWPHWHPFHGWAPCLPLHRSSRPGTTMSTGTTTSDMRTSCSSNAATGLHRIPLQTTVLTMELSATTTTALATDSGGCTTTRRLFKTGRRSASITPRSLTSSLL